MACGPAHPVRDPGAKRQLAILPVESDTFPVAARAVGAMLVAAKVKDIDAMRVSKVSIEVVQLSIECLEPTNACYEAAGRSMSANRLLFARIEGGTRRLKLTVTLFDVDAREPKRSQVKVFATEAEAIEGAPTLVEVVTQ